MAWKLENIRKDPNSKEQYADLFTSQIKEEPKTACLFTIGDARAVEIILEKYKNTQFVVFDYPALIKFLDFAKPTNLLKAIPLKYDWESEGKFLKFVETEILQIYNINNMSFDLIIANPPYGLNNSIAKKIIPILIHRASEVVVLVPKNTYKDKTCLEHMKSIRIVDNVFEDASVQNLSISLLSKDWVNTDITVESVSLSSKQMKLATAIRGYNKTHLKPYNRLKFSGAPIGNKMEKTVKEAALEGICDYLKPIADMKLKDARDSNLFFVITVWTPLDGVHTNQAHDWTYNLEGKWDPDWNRMCPVNAFVFLNKQERDNFSKWWYSCLEREQGKKFRSGLTNACLDLIRDAISSSGGYYETYFPNLDWSHPWTDEEILKELGLPEDFLEKKE